MGRQDDLVLSLVGDMMLGRLVGRDAAPARIWGADLLAATAGSVWCGNLETAISGVRCRWPHKTFHFVVPPARAAALLAPLQATHCAVALNLANNHIMDACSEGLLETVETLDALGLAYAGAGRSLAESRALTVIDNACGSGLRFGMLGAADQLRAWAAGPQRPGLWYVDIDAGPAAWHDLLAGVQRAARAVDVLVVYLHYGPNWPEHVTTTHRALMRALIDAGASVAVGTSPHHLQEVERHRGGLICYSLGDCVDDYAVDPLFRNDLTAVVQARFRAVSSGRDRAQLATSLTDVRLLPAKIERLSVRLLLPRRDAAEYAWVIAVLTRGFRPFTPLSLPRVSSEEAD